MKKPSAILSSTTLGGELPETMFKSEGSEQEERGGREKAKKKSRTLKRRQKYQEENALSSTTQTSLTTPIPPSPTAKKLRASLTAKYINVGCSQAVTHVALNETQNHDVLFIGEPYIHTTDGGGLGHPIHPAWRRVTALSKHSMVVAFVNTKVQGAKDSINKPGTVATVSIAFPIY